MQTPPPPRAADATTSPTFKIAGAFIGVAVVVVAGAMVWRSQVRARAYDTAVVERAAGNATRAVELLQPFFDPKSPPDDLVRNGLAGAWLDRTETHLKHHEYSDARQALGTAKTFGVRGSFYTDALDKSAPRIDREEIVHLIGRNELAAAASALSRQGKNAEALELLSHGGHLKELRELSREKKMTRDAVVLLTKHQQFAEAAELSEEMDAWKEAAAAWQRAGHTERAVAAAWKHLAHLLKNEPPAKAEDFLAWADARSLGSPLKAEMRKRLSEIRRLCGEAKSPRALAPFLIDQGFAHTASEVLGDAGDWASAVEVCLEIPDRTKAEAIAKRGVAVCLEKQDFTTLNKIAGAFADKALRPSLAKEFAMSFTEEQTFELAAFLAAAQQWPAAAANYEKAGSFRAAADAWERAGQRAEVARTLCLIPDLKNDSYLALRAARALDGVDTEKRERLLQHIFEAASARPDFELLGAIYAERGQMKEGAALLLDKGEAVADSNPHEAWDILTAVAHLLPKSSASRSTQELFKRCEALGANIKLSLWSFPRVDLAASKVTNVYRIDRFEHTEGEIVVENRSDRPATFRLQIECFDRSPEIFFKPGSSAALRNWAWSDRSANQVYTNSQADFESEKIVLTLAVGERRFVKVAMTNTVPYAKWRPRILAVEFADSPK